MPDFKLVSTSTGGRSMAFRAQHPAECLNVASRHAVSSANLYQDGAYLFTISQAAAGSGGWLIQTRNDLAGTRLSTTTPEVSARAAP